VIHPDEWYMHKALALAHRAAERYDEVPIGAVVVDKHGVIIGRASNSVERKKTQAAHAEVLALVQAGKKSGDWRLEECTIFVTLEPCGMCMDLIQLSRIARVVYGATSPLFSYRLDNQGQVPIYKKNSPVIVSGICQERSGELLKDFFKKKRRESRVWSKEDQRDDRP
jgi:tRNA(adenine34) deaminase